MRVPHTKTFYAVFNVSNFCCYRISSSRSKRANGKVIIVVGIKIDQNILNVLLQKMQLPEEKRPGQVSAALTSVPCGLKTLQTGWIQKPTNEVFTFLHFWFVRNGCPVLAFLLGLCVEWGGGARWDYIKIITFLKCDTNSCVFFQSAALGSACRSVIQLKIVLSCFKWGCPAQYKH